ncbi:MAG: hypothetical protein Q8N99_08490 [Nanoarchaeota archaeon]|nr:hypothetical protein [Nanoarchaeota archaeon]
MKKRKKRNINQGKKYSKLIFIGFFSIIIGLFLITIAYNLTSETKNIGKEYPLPNINECKSLNDGELCNYDINNNQYLGVCKAKKCEICKNNAGNQCSKCEKCVLIYDVPSCDSSYYEGLECFNGESKGECRFGVCLAN